MNKLPMLSMKVNVMYLLLIAFASVFVAGGNTKKNVGGNTRADSVAQANGRRSDDGGGMDMMAMGNDMMSKEKKRDGRQ